MNKTIVIDLSGESIEKAIKSVEQYQKWVERKSKELAKRLAEIGATSASLGFARALYTGPKDVAVSVRKRGDGYAVIAKGETVLFIEFGAGIHFGGGHPEAGEFGMGPGTYPDGKGHWNDPKGWYLPKSRQGSDGTKHTYGNPAEMPMYNARKEIEQNITQIVREVFQLD